MKKFTFTLFFLMLLSLGFAQKGNKLDRLNWFENLGFGMFIHWNVDVSLGAVISHSMAGASDEYNEKYIN